MRFNLPTLLSTLALASAKNLRLNRGRGPKKLDETCTALIAEVNSGGSEESFLVCEINNGKTYKVKSANGDFIKNNFEKGAFKSGETDLIFDTDAMIDEDNATIESKTPPGLKKKDSASNGPKRNLAITIDNNKTVLAVKVIASGSASTYSEAQLSDSIFGNAGDLWNLKQGYSDCSRGQLIINEAADRNGFNISISNGVVTVDLGTSIALNANDATMSNAVTAALNSAFSVDSPSELADHVMYCLPPTVNWDGIAYAYVNNWNSVYNDDWCTYPSAQMHEIGGSFLFSFHNLNLAHSGQGSDRYNDVSGVMGYSYSQDETPKMCFNGAKNFQLGWFTPRHKVVSSNYVGELQSTLEYDPNNPNPEVAPMLIKIPNGGNDFFLAFNRATSYNAGTNEGQNQVMLTHAGDGSNYKVSNLRAKLGAGASYSFSANGNNVKVTVQSINTFRFGFANISLCFNGNCDTQSPTRAPTTNPTMSPTKSTEQPSPSPSAAPTACLDYDWNLRFFVEEVGGNRSCEWVARTSTGLRCSYVEPAIRCRKTCNMCANSPSVTPTISFHPSASTSSPTASPTSSPTASPTAAPTNSPTASTSSPTASPTAAPTNSPTASTASPTASPTAAPTNSPTASTASPTASPTAAPTNAPTQHPTYSPTNAPSKSNATTSAPFTTSTQQPSPAPTLTPASACSLYNWNRKGCKAMSNCSYNNRTKQCVMLFPASVQRANECYSSKQSCSLGACCSGVCERNGKWAGTCK